MRGEVVKIYVCLDQMKRELIKSCQKDVEKLPTTNPKFVQIWISTLWYRTKVVKLRRLFESAMSGTRARRHLLRLMVSLVKTRVMLIH